MGYVIATRLARWHGNAVRARARLPLPPSPLPFPFQSLPRVMFARRVVFTISIFRLISAMLELRVLNIIPRIPPPVPSSSCLADTLPSVSNEEKEEANLRALRCHLSRPSCIVISTAGKQTVNLSLTIYGSTRGIRPSIDKIITARWDKLVKLDKKAWRGVENKEINLAS